MRRILHCGLLLLFAAGSLYASEQEPDPGTPYPSLEGTWLSRGAKTVIGEGTDHEVTVKNGKFIERSIHYFNTKKMPKITDVRKGSIEFKGEFLLVSTDETGPVPHTFHFLKNKFDHEVLSFPVPVLKGRELNWAGSYYQTSIEPQGKQASFKMVFSADPRTIDEGKVLENSFPNCRNRYSKSSMVYTFREQADRTNSTIVMEALKQNGDRHWLCSLRLYKDNPTLFDSSNRVIPLASMRSYIRVKDS